MLFKMKKNIVALIVILLFSCENNETVTIPEKFSFNYNLHSSLPQEWISEFNIIMENLDRHIPIKSNSYLTEMEVYAWKSSEENPFKSMIGNTGGACICGNDKERFMVLEIPELEFEYDLMHRFSVIPHEVFHVYQMGLSENFFRGDGPKWIIEGGAASLESLYIQQYYSYDYFSDAQSNIDEAVNLTPEIYESYNSNGDKDQNYASSVFMVLALVKELQKLGDTEEVAFRKIFKDFWERNPDNNNWKNIFREIFGLELFEFYAILKDGISYKRNIIDVKPNYNLKLDNIFNK